MFWFELEFWFELVAAAITIASCSHQPNEGEGEGEGEVEVGVWCRQTADRQVVAVKDRRGGGGDGGGGGFGCGVVSDFERTNIKHWPVMDNKPGVSMYVCVLYLLRMYVWRVCGCVCVYVCM